MAFCAVSVDNALGSIDNLAHSCAVQDLALGAFWISRCGINVLTDALRVALLACCAIAAAFALRSLDNLADSSLAQDLPLWTLRVFRVSRSNRGVYILTDTLRVALLACCAIGTSSALRSFNNLTDTSATQDLSVRASWVLGISWLWADERLTDAESVANESGITVAIDFTDCAGQNFAHPV